MKRTIQFIAAGLMTLSLTLHFSACTEQTPMQSTKNGVEISLAKQAAGAYPQYAERTFLHNSAQNAYQGGNMKVNGGSTFHLVSGALTPPPDTPFGERVTLTMLVERDPFRSELIFTFGPHGCQFNPPAEVWLDWKDLHSDNATLYYIDSNGNYIPQAPAEVDMQGKRLKIYINHFSRYALGAE